MKTNNIMKLGTAIAVVQLLASGASAVGLIDENLDSDGNGTRYYANEFYSTTSATSADFNHRTNANSGFETQTVGAYDPSYVNSGYFWNMRDLDGDAAPDDAFKTDGRGLIRFKSTDLSGFNFEKLTVSIDLAIGTFNDRFEDGSAGSTPGNDQDFFDIQYSFDNALNPFASSEAALLADEANFTSLAKFVGSNQNSTDGALGFNSGGGVGLNGEGAASGEVLSAGNLDAGSGFNPALIELNIPFKTFTFDLDLTGLSHSSVTFELMGEFDAGNEIFAWDNFKVEGIEAIVTPPTPTVPDSSATGILLGSALIGLFACRRFKRS